MNQLTRLKVDLLCKGIRVDTKAPYAREIVPEAYAEGGKSRAGVDGSGNHLSLTTKNPVTLEFSSPSWKNHPTSLRSLTTRAGY